MGLERANCESLMQPTDLKCLAGKAKVPHGWLDSMPNSWMLILAPTVATEPSISKVNFTSREETEISHMVNAATYYPFHRHGSHSGLTLGSIRVSIYTFNSCTKLGIISPDQRDSR